MTKTQAIALAITFGNIEPRTNVYRVKIVADPANLNGPKRILWAKGYTEATDILRKNRALIALHLLGKLTGMASFAVEASTATTLPRLIQAGLDAS